MGVQIITGDCRDILRTLPDESVHCVVTSPPYWGLRDYGTTQWKGGDASCDHLGPSMRTNNKPSNNNSSFHGGIARANEPMGRICSKCGANRFDSQMGQEKTLGEHVEGMVEVFRDVRRVLRRDGTLWLNYGDSYAASGKGGNPEGSQWSGFVGNKDREQSAMTNGTRGRPKPPDGLKPKDLCGIPWRVAFALQADGWWLRSDIIWSKPNPMPESVTDRPTKAHEYLFLLAKSERYYYDQNAIREEPSGRTDPITSFGKPGAPQNGQSYQLDGLVGRNRRTVWEIPTSPFAEAHFATFPPALIEPCILAGCPKGGTVLDPFGGAGTTGLVADRLGRNAILIELNTTYADMAERRIKGDAGLFASVSNAPAQPPG